MGKGSQQRPRFISDEEWNLRWDLAYGKTTIEEFDRRLKEIKENDEYKNAYQHLASSNDRNGVNRI